MLKTFCSLCGTEIVGRVQDTYRKPKIEETRMSITGEEIKVMFWCDWKIVIGSLCACCEDMYIEKLLTALATTRKAARG